MPLRPLFAIAAIFTPLVVSIAPAHANSTCDRLENPLERTYCKEETSLANARPASSPAARHRYLAQAVSQVVYGYYKQTGEVLPVTHETIAEVIRITGASQSEAAFVIDQLVASVQAISALPPLQTL